MDALFEFAFVYLVNDGPLLLFVHEKKGARDNVREYAASYNFVLRKDWWGSTNCRGALQRLIFDCTSKL